MGTMHNMSNVILKSKRFFPGRKFVPLFRKITLFWATASLSMAAYAQNTENAALPSDPVIDPYIQSRGDDCIVLDPSNIKQYWIESPVASNVDRICILLDRNNESIPLKIELANVGRTQDCIVEVLTETPDASFTVTDGLSKELAASTEKDMLSQYHVLESSPVHLSETTSNSFFLRFRTKGIGQLVIRRIILSFASNRNYLAPPVELLLSAGDATARNGEIRNDDDDPYSFTAVGNTTEVLFDKKILIGDNAVSASVRVKNTGGNNATVSCGYALYTEDDLQIGSQNNPYKGNKVLTVVSSQAHSRTIVVDSCPEWEKGCRLVLNAREDMSDFPNFAFLEGTIESITQKDDAHTEILLDQPIRYAIERGTQLRVQSLPGSPYLYTDSKILHPGEEATFTSSIRKNDSCLLYSSSAVCRGTFYVVPVIVSCSYSAEPNTIGISDFRITSGEAVEADGDPLSPFPGKETIKHARIMRTIAEKTAEKKNAPVAVSVIPPKKAKKANMEATRYQRNQAVASSWHSFLRRNNITGKRVCFLIAPIPLVVITIFLFRRKKKGGNKE